MMSKKCKDSGKSSLQDAITSAGFKDVNMVRKAAAVLSDPEEIAELMGVDPNEFEALLEQTELLSLYGLGSKYIGLLQAVGITSVAQLSISDPFQLHEQIKAAANHYEVGRIPNRATIEDWIEDAIDMNWQK